MVCTTSSLQTLSAANLIPKEDSSSASHSAVMHNRAEMSISHRCGCPDLCRDTSPRGLYWQDHHGHQRETCSI